MMSRATARNVYSNIEVDCCCVPVARKEFGSTHILIYKATELNNFVPEAIWILCSTFV